MYAACFVPSSVPLYRMKSPRLALAGMKDLAEFLRSRYGRVNSSGPGNDDLLLHNYEDVSQISSTSVFHQIESHVVRT